MTFKRKSALSLPVVVSIGATIVLAGTALYAGGYFPTITKSISGIFASNAKPIINTTFTDNFKDGTIDAAKWDKVVGGDVTVFENVSDNLKFNIPAGSVGGALKQGKLIYKELLKDKMDFVVSTVAFKPIVTGTGTGTEGMRFVSASGSDKEGAVVRWEVNGATSKIRFVVTDKDGKVLVNSAADVFTNSAAMRLVRVNREYKAYYKSGTDINDELGWNLLGVCDRTAETNNCNATLTGQDGKLSLFAHNGGTKDAFPKVVARFDRATIGTQTGTSAPATVETFNDEFSNGNLGSVWAATKSSGVEVTENTNNMLMVQIPALSVNGNPAVARIKRLTPSVGVEKDFTYYVQLKKPALVGDGSGYAGLVFASPTVQDKEGASVRWIVTKSGTTSTSKLVFLVNDKTGGPLVERASVNVNNAKLTLGLRRNGNLYKAFYRVGDSDSDWVQIGDLAVSDNFGSAGSFYLTSSNQGVNKKYPAVTSQFDRVWGSVQK